MRYLSVIFLVFVLASCAVFKPQPQPKTEFPQQAQKTAIADSLIIQGLVLFSDGHDSLAMAKWREAIKLNPTIPEAHNYLGIALKKENRLSEALQEFKQAVRLDSTYYQAWNNAGYTLFLLNRFAQAETFLQKALQINPNFEKARDNLRLVKEVANGKLSWDVFSMTEELDLDPDATEQIKGYERVLEMDSSYAKAHNNLAVIFYYEGKTDSAFKHLYLALKYRKDYPEAINNLGYLYKQQGDYDKAIRFFFKALTLKPRYIDALNNLGETYILKGEEENARRVFNTVLELQPNNAVARNMLRSINAKK